MKNPRWTKDEIETLREGYVLKMPLKIIAAKVGRTVKACKTKAMEQKFPMLNPHWASSGPTDARTDSLLARNVEKYVALFGV